MSDYSPPGALAWATRRATNLPTWSTGGASQGGGTRPGLSGGRERRRPARTRQNKLAAFFQGAAVPRSCPPSLPLFNTGRSAREEEGHLGIINVLTSRWSRRLPAPATLGGKQPWLLCGGSPGLVAAARASCASCDLAPYARASLGGQAVGRPAMHKPWPLTTPNANRPWQHSKQS